MGRTELLAKPTRGVLRYRAMRRPRFSMVVALLLTLASGSAAHAAASVDRIEDFGTVLAVASPEDFPVGSLMRADCAFLVRVEQPDGSAKETQVCTLSTAPVIIPAFQGTPPDRAFHFGGGACIWSSDYWFTFGAVAPVYAESFRYVVTPSGQVRITSHYPADPLVCESAAATNTAAR